MKTKTVDNPFTEQDVRDAMRAYDGDYVKWPIRVIESTTGIRINRNKRSWREQALHLKLARAIRDITCDAKGLSSWRDGSGRKPQSALVKEWRMKHPDCTNKALCARETGLSRPTVHRWWDVYICHESDEKTTDD